MNLRLILFLLMVSIYCSLPCNAQESIGTVNQTLVVEVQTDSPLRRDTLNVIVSPVVYKYNDRQGRREYSTDFIERGQITVGDINHGAYLQFGGFIRLLSRDGYMKLRTGKFFWLEPGSNLKIVVQNGDLIFSGQLGKLMECQWKLADIPTFNYRNKEDRRLFGSFPNYDTSYFTYYKKMSDSLKEIRLKLLDQYSPYLTFDAYQQLRTDIELAPMGAMLSMLRLIIREPRNQARVQTLLNYYQSISTKLILNVPDKYICRSAFFDDYWQTKIILDILCKRENEISETEILFIDKIRYVLDNFNGVIKERLLAGLCNSTASYSGSAADYNLISTSVNSFENEGYKEKVIRFLSTRTAGIPAYNFSLSDQDDKIYHLKDFTGKVVLVDFWFTGCTWCAKYYKNVLSKVQHFYKEDTAVVFISISGDDNKAVWCNSVKEGSYTSATALNLMAGLTSPVFEKFNVIAFPTSVIIDRKQDIFSFDKSKLENINDLIDLIEKAKTSH